MSYRFRYSSCLCAAALLAIPVFAQNARPGAPSSDSALAAKARPADAKAAKSYAKALRELSEGKYPLALADFRKADQEDGGHCISCEVEAYKAAKQMEDYKAAREETALLLSHVTDPVEQAEAHFLAGEACLSEGGYRIFEEPFQQADSEFKAALQLQPGKRECLFEDGVALAHLHRYGSAKERFQQYLKDTPQGSVQYARARLFSDEPELARKRVAPEFHVVGLDGKTISLDSFAGKVVLVDFWATWCGPCRQALPKIKQIAQEFQGQPLVIVSISLDEDENTWKNFVAQNGMTWLQYRDGGFDGELASRFAVKAIPSTFTIDAQGFLQDHQVGSGDIETKLRELIAKAQDSAATKTVGEVR